MAYLRIVDSALGPPAPPAPVFLLDSMTAVVAWASWLGGLLRTGQTSIATVRRFSDDATADLADFVNYSGYVVRAALEAWAQGQDVEVLDVTNAVDASPYPSVAAVEGRRARVVVEGVAVVGGNGYIAARFSDDEYTGTFALVGDVDATLAFDVGPGGYFGRAGVSRDGDIDNGIQWSAEWWGTDPGGSEYIVGYQAEVDDPADYVKTDPGTAPVTGGLIQASRASGDDISETVCKWNGAVVTQTAVNGAVVPTFAGDTLAWGSNAYGQDGVSASLLAFWTDVLDAGNQATFDAWWAAHV